MPIIVLNVCYWEVISLRTAGVKLWDSVHFQQHLDLVQMSNWGFSALSTARNDPWGYSLRIEHHWVWSKKAKTKKQNLTKKNPKQIKKKKKKKTALIITTIKN